jgi:hypothetical protein
VRTPLIQCVVLVSLTCGLLDSRLYDLATDRTELKKPAQQQPERVDAMAKVFDQWKRESNK